MIGFSKYLRAIILSFMGMYILQLDSHFPVLYSVVGGLFVGTSLRWAIESAEDKKSEK